MRCATKKASNLQCMGLLMDVYSTADCQSRQSMVTFYRSEVGHGSLLYIAKTFKEV